MRSIIALTLGLLFLSLTFRSCAWHVMEETVEQEQLQNEISRRRRTEKSYPMAEAQSSQDSTPFQIRQAAATLPELAPLKEEVRQNPHSAPPSLMNGLSEFSAVVEMARAGGEQAEEAARFFESCAVKEGAPTAIRAVCLRHLWDLKGLENSQATTTAVSEKVRKIAGRLASTLPRVN